MNFNARVLKLKSALFWVLTIALLGLACVAKADDVTLRWSQFNGVGPVNTGAYNNWYPVSIDKVSFVLIVRNSKKMLPGHYTVYRKKPDNTIEMLWSFDVMGDGQMFASPGGSLGYTHSVELLVRYANQTNGSEPIDLYVERTPADINDAPVKYERHWNVKYEWRGDHNEFWTSFWMSSFYIHIAETKAFFIIGGDDYYQPDEGGTPIPQGGSDPEPGGSAPPPQPIFDDCSGGGVGMATYTLDIARAGFQVTDTPLTYAVPRGPSVAFTLNYRLFDESQESSLSFTNLGKHWSNSFISYIKGGPPAASENAWHYLAGGGQEEFVGLDKTHPGPGSGGFFERGPYSKSQLEWVNDGANSHYVLRTVGGSVMRFASPDKPGDPECRYFLTEAADPFGNKLSYTYETLPSNGGFRLTGVADAAGQITTLAYENSSFPLQITKVTDPFGRFASITYDGQGRLVSVIDPIGIVSSFAYDEQHAYLNRLVTPYGTTSFEVQSTPGHQILEVTNTKGIKERVEFLLKNPHFPSAEPVGDVPAVAQTHNTGLDTYNAYYWTREAMMHAAAENIQPGTPAFYQKAIASHLLMGSGGVTRVVGSFKKPLESRVWYLFADQAEPNRLPSGVKAPSTAARKLPNGQDQVSTSSFNDLGKTVQSSDPLGRTTVYTYHSNGRDLLTIQRLNGSNLETLVSFSNYVNNIPTVITDAASQSTTLTLNSYGQMLTSRNAKSEVSTCSYNSSGQMITSTRPGGFGITVSYYPNGNIQTITDTEGYATTYEYDTLNRKTKTIFPDSTFAEATYKYLDVEWIRDRLGRSTHLFYDTERKLIAIEDPAGQAIKYGYCACGVLLSLTDAKGQVTKWEYDVQSRTIKQIYPDNSFETTTYDSVGRLATTIDVMGQVATHSYNNDNSVAGRAWSNLAPGTAATPPVNYTYDAIYSRLATMTDHTGTTSYTYNPYNGLLGAGRMASVSGPVGTGTYTMTAQYDELGRTVSTTLDGVTSSVTYDTMSRVATENNALGTFTYSYIGNTSRIATVAYPNGMTLAYDYENNVEDMRLKQIKYTSSTSTILAQFDYTYNAQGMIKTWRQQLGSHSAYTWHPAYDAADQLVAVDQVDATTKALQKRWDYGYDPAGNRLTHTFTDAVANTVSPSAATFNNLNQILTLTPGVGKITIDGVTNKTATVTINGQPAQIDPASSGKRFAATIPAPATPATNATLNVTATDSTSQATTKSYTIPFIDSGTPKAFAYDAKGNTLFDGKQSYTWDALGQLVAIDYTTGPHSGMRTEFVYNGHQERVAIIEKDNLGAITSTKRYIWFRSARPIKERNNDANTATSYFQQGEFIVNSISEESKVYYLHDHLDSVRTLVDINGDVRANYAYSPFGEREQISGDVETSMAYTGHELHSRSGLILTKYRFLDNSISRWISSDPIGLSGGLNLYSYVANNPLSLYDPLGLQAHGATPPPNIPGGPWTWTPNNPNAPMPGNSRGGDYTSPSGARASWDDKDSHWDVDPGKKGSERQRYDRWGNPIDKDQAHDYRQKKKKPKQKPITNWKAIKNCGKIIIIIIAFILGNT
ncbi:hypothetical protein DB346_15790 [Verrucomicrobia bacterium LW23]|nr:hypothetical protein DB346_15790 [Verrucomicrobia bacterium LW23]